MALKLAIPTPYGVTAEYWKIAQLNVNTLGPSAHVDLVGFTSQEAREAYPAVQPIAVRSFDWPPGILEFGHEINNFAVAYAQIKAWPAFDADGQPIPAEFADAVDC